MQGKNALLFVNIALMLVCLKNLIAAIASFIPIKKTLFRLWRLNIFHRFSLYDTKYDLIYIYITFSFV